MSELSQELIIKNTHIIAAVLALIIYVIRGLMMLANSSAVNSRFMLAASSLFTIMIFTLGMYRGFAKHLSFADGFMLTQIISFLLFVSFGVISLKKGLSKPKAIIFWLIGLAAFIYTFLIGSKIFTPLF